MYYCKNCKKYIKQGNVCDSCGRQMTPQDGIIFCPECNKSFFNPGMDKKFTCQSCGAQIVVNKEFLMNQKGKTEVNKVGSIYKSNDNQSSFDSDNGIGFNSNQMYDDNNAQTNNQELNSNNNMQYSNFRQDTPNLTENKFPHASFNNQAGQQNTAMQEQNGVAKQNNVATNNETSEFNEDLFEEVDAGEVSKSADKKVSKKEKGDKPKKGISSVLSFISISLMFVIVLFAVFYFFILPLIIPSYKLSWDKYITATNHLQESKGVDQKLNTVEFNVEGSSSEQVVATIKVNEKTYNESTKKYDERFITYQVTFVKKNGVFVIEEMIEL